LDSEKAITNLIGSAYEAASEPSLWEPLLEELANTCRADSAALVLHHRGCEVHSVSSSWNLEPDGNRLYQQHYGSIDVWTIRAPSKPRATACLSDWLCPLAELTTTEFYNDFLLRYGIVHGMFGLLQYDKTSWASVSLYKGSLSGEFQPSDLETLNLLLPHIQRASRLHFQFSQLKGRSEGVEAALNVLTTGVIVLGAKGEILVMNNRAEQILNLRNGLLLNHGRLEAAVCAESTRLLAMIGEATKTGSGAGRSAYGTILISREQRRPLSVTVSPLHEFNRSLLQRSTAVLFISDPEINPELPDDLLQRCYGLTHAEARLAMLLLNGYSLRESADSCGVTHSTVKSQLKSIFLKTQVKRQGELIRLLLSTAGVMRPTVEAR
jgi:DNA-binding CsgD family transcriptional regulator